MLVAVYLVAAIAFYICYFLARKFICKKKEHSTVFKFLFCGGGIVLPVVGILTVVSKLINIDTAGIYFDIDLSVNILCMIFYISAIAIFYSLYKWEKTTYYAIASFVLCSILLNLMGGTTDLSIALGSPAGLWPIFLGLGVGAKSKFLK